MSIAYGLGGYAPGTLHQNTRKAWDKLLHEAVVNKQAFKGLIGQDKGGEGSIDSEVANKPIVQKTQLGKESGDQITMSLVASQISTTPYNDGKVGNTQLVDAESSLTPYNVKVKIAHQRFGIEIDGKMTLQKSAFDVVTAAKNNLSQQMASNLDRGVFFTYYSGFSPNVLREIGTSALSPVAHPNNIYGKGQSALTAVTQSDVLDTSMLEIVRVFSESNNIAPIMVDGEPQHILFVHPYNGRTLRADSAWVDANVNGMPRSAQNPVFQNAIGSWAGIVVKESNNISTAKAWSALTATAGTTISLVDATVGAGIVATDVYALILTGANAVARAFALESYMVRRKEDDYENILGFAGGYIYGDRRTDWAASADTGTDGTTYNQSSCLLYAHKGDATALTIPSVGLSV